MSVDKKVKAGRIRLILLESLGSAAIVADTAEDTLRAALRAAAAR
jgi:3-dehydroquinate synthetase